MASELKELLMAYRERFHLPDPTPLYAALACFAANFLNGNPVWLLLVGAQGSGKSEILELFVDLDRVFPTAEVTVAGLLSGVGVQDRAPGAKGGLLREIGSERVGFILAKDFGTVLNMNAESRLQTFAALREIYDGSYTRRLG